MLTIHTSNRLERLADALATQLREHPAPPFTPEVVVVQSLGTRRWLSFALAERLGVAMNIRCPFPTEFVEQVFATLLPGAPPSPIFRRAVLPWRILSVLPEVLNDAEFADLHRYVGGDPVKLWDVSRQIAAVFDRYLAYRPEMLCRWDAGETLPEQPWQPRLWRRLSEHHRHPAELAAKVNAAGAETNEDLPPRVHFFGLSTLPPFHVGLIGELANRCDIHLYQLSPTREYWGDIRSETEQARLRRWCERRSRRFDAAEYTVGHPLLSSLGRIGREFHEALLDLTPAHEVELFEPPARDTLLAHLQREIFELAPLPDERSPISTGDRSIQVHNCHSPLREVEVLHDQLLALFAADSSLEPRDVLVATPDITAYAPFVDAVFGAPENDAVRFPYTIADRATRAQNEVTDAFLRMLELVGSRFSASTVLSLLDCPSVCARFGLTDSDLPALRRWVAESGIRWGRDGAQRKSLSFPEWKENTWEFGLDRLLLGFALPPNGYALFDDILPYGNVEGSLAETLGRFSTFLRTIFRIAQECGSQPRTPLAWSELLSDVLAELCASDGDFAEAWRTTAEPIHAMADSARLGTCETPLPFEVIRAHLAGAFDEAEIGTEFLRGGITFCSLRPMRTIPHRIIALLGLNHDAFPRTARPPSFDLTASHPRPGDRTLRDDDRYLFLENLLSARDSLYLSYCGQSPKDDSTMPPSVLIVELLDHLERTHVLPAGASVREFLTIQHPLQPFHARYFRGPRSRRTVSYSEELADAARAAELPRQPRAPFVSAQHLPGPLSRELTLDALIDCLTHATRFFAREILGLALPREEARLEDVEPFALDPLVNYSLGEALIAETLAGGTPRRLHAAVKAEGILPHGLAGARAFDSIAGTAQNLVDTLDELAPAAPKAAQAGEVLVNGWRLRGQIQNRRGNKLVRIRCAAVKPKDLLRAWAIHLFASALEPAAHFETLILARDKTQLLQPVAAPLSELERLLDLYATAHTRPLPFFPVTSHAYASGVLGRSRSKKDPMQLAREAWFNDDDERYGRAEGADDWNALVWREPADPLDREFQILALAIFTPLFAALKPVR